jgi:hypothetical protein
MTVLQAVVRSWVVIAFGIALLELLWGDVKRARAREVIVGFDSKTEIVTAVAAEDWEVDLMDLGVLLLHLVLLEWALVADEQVLVEMVALTVSKVLEEVLLVEDFLGFAWNVGLEWDPE